MGADWDLVHSPMRDYPWRIQLTKPAWKRVVVELVEEQTWSNFKNEVKRFGGRDEYEKALHDVWFTMQRIESKKKVIGLKGEDRKWNKSLYR